LATSILLGMCMILIGLPGGLIWLVGWDITRPRRGPARHESLQTSAPSALKRCEAMSDLPLQQAGRGWGSRRPSKRERQRGPTGPILIRGPMNEKGGEGTPTEP
jgi:hypothetical protein